MSLLGSGLSGPTRLNALRQRVVIWVAADRCGVRRAEPERAAAEPAALSYESRSAARARASRPSLSGRPQPSRPW